MAYKNPSLDELSKRVRRLFAAAVNGADTSIWPNTWTILAKVLAPLALEFHLRLGWLYKQMFAKDADEVHLAKHGWERGVNRRPATRASGFATMAAGDGLILPAALRVQRSDGAVFISTAVATSLSGQIVLALRAETPGQLGNCNAAEPFSAVEPDVFTAAWHSSGLSDPVPTQWVITADQSGLGGGADLEDLESYRARVLKRKRNVPGGGNVADWNRWVSEVPGVSRVIVDRFSNDIRSVWICVFMDGRDNNIPTASDIAVVQAAIDDPFVRPLTCNVVVVAPVLQPIDIRIADLVPDTAVMRAAVEAELFALFATKAEPATPSQLSTFPMAWIDQAIGLAPGYMSHRRLAPTDQIIIVTPGKLPSLGNIFFT